MGLDVTGRHPLRVQRDDVAGQPVQPALPFAHRHRVEAGVAVPRHVERDLAHLGGHRLGITAVAAVAAAPTLHGVRFIAEMVGHLHLQPGLQHLPHQRGQQPVVAGQLHPLTAGPGDELGRPIPHRRLITHQRDDRRHRSASRLPSRTRRRWSRSRCRSHRIVILSGPRRSVADPRITPGYTDRRTLPAAQRHNFGSRPNIRPVGGGVQDRLHYVGAVPVCAVHHAKG
jgi:hypothetical protein